MLVGGGGNNARNGHGWAVDLAHHEPAQNDGIELGVGSAGEESVQLDQESNVRVLALWRLAVAAGNVVLVCNRRISRRLQSIFPLFQVERDS